ncbi:MAG: SDR family oxidoreductase [Hahellaceae bacterium]|nr:SDR family oxidoreductase [Hahellaceae bacterium]
MTHSLTRRTTRFAGKTALITGASSGIGESMAHLLAAQQCHLILVARRLSRLESLRDKLVQQHGIKVEIIAADLLVPGAAQQVFNETVNRGLRVDVLINNAGFGKNGDFLEVPLESHTQMIQLNITALTEMTYLFAEAMKHQGGGDILQVASIAAFMPTPSFSTYGAGKAYVLNFSEALSRELKPHNIRVTALCPGGTLTEFMDVSGQQITGLRTKAMMTSESVAKAGLKALEKGHSAIVPGWLYKVSIASLRLIPRSLQARLAEDAMR